MFHSFLVILAVSFFSGLQISQAKEGVVYGEDGRLEYYQALPQYQKLADSTVALFEAGSLRYVPSTQKVLIPQQSLANRYRTGAGLDFCSGERFTQQTTAAFCSGTLVGPDLVLTAGHCVDAETCGSTVMTFGFAIKSSQDIRGPQSFDAKDVYTCKEVVFSTLQPEGADFAIVRLNRPVTDRTPLKINEGGIRQGTPLVLMGHPSGLPLKIAGGAAVRNAQSGWLDLDWIFNERFFVANTDSYGGNSGGAVLNAKTGLIEGILVRGEADYIARTDRMGRPICLQSNVCADDGCRGEAVTKASAFKWQLMFAPWF